MGRNARRREPAYGSSFVRNMLLTAGEGAMRNPLAVGATTAFLVAFSFVSANALWYQPHFYKEAFFSTRSHADRQAARAASAPAPATRTPASPAAAPAPAVADPLVQKVQASLAKLKLYSGPVDGLDGPQTGQAIAVYQKSAGLPASGHIDGFLLKRLGILQTNPPQEAPRPAPRPQLDAATTQSVPPGNDKARIIKIQAGLKAFGNDGIELDGMIGPKTTAGIKEFQSLFGLNVSGVPDAATYAKMREVGLIE